MRVIRSVMLTNVQAVLVASNPCAGILETWNKCDDYTCANSTGGEHSLCRNPSDIEHTQNVMMINMQTAQVASNPCVGILETLNKFKMR